MNLSRLVPFYFSANISITILYLLARISIRLEAPANHVLKYCYRGMAILSLLALAQPFLPHPQFFQPPVKVWSASSPKQLPPNLKGADQSVLTVAGLPKKAFLSVNQVTSAFDLFLISVLAAYVVTMLRDVTKLLRLQRNSFRVRKIGRLEIRVSDQISVPLSFWLPFFPAVVIPNQLVVDIGEPGRKSDLRLSILHELQHHRQGDTQWIFAINFLRFFFCINPFVHFWNRMIGELQEFACDEALVDRKWVSSQAYASCLLRVAETALSQNECFACATGLTFWREGKLLKKRIMTMLMPKQKAGWNVTLGIGTLATFLLVCAAWGSQDLIRDRQVSLQQAQEMAKNVDSTFPIVVNDLVLEELNHYLGTPDGREFIQSSLVRMEQYRPLIERKLKEYGVPEELMAIPIVESGYQNLLPSPDISRSAGVWQFVQSTAWLYTLNVWPPIDERLDPEKETDAAMRLLLGDKIRFGSWDLSILAYNSGEKLVSKGILKTKSHDAWTLIKNGYENDRGYLAKVMAAVLILKNRATLQ